jgi:hypothetical protein
MSTTGYVTRYRSKCTLRTGLQILYHGLRRRHSLTRLRSNPSGPPLPLITSRAQRAAPDILAFRGTAQGIDWVTDALVIPIPFAGRLCHGGFTLAFLSVWGKIKKHVRMDHPLLICGHSLGGGLGELAASKLHKKHKRLSLCTFGKPNTFFKGFKRPMQLTRQVSCVSGSDIVARIPRFCYGPSVSQTILYFANDGKDHVNPPAELKRDDFMAAKNRRNLGSFHGGLPEDA